MSVDAEELRDWSQGMERSACIALENGAEEIAEGNRQLALILSAAASDLERLRYDRMYLATAIANIDERRCDDERYTLGYMQAVEDIRSFVLTGVVLKGE